MTLITVAEFERKISSGGKPFVRLCATMPDGSRRWATMWGNGADLVADRKYDAEMVDDERDGRIFTTVRKLSPAEMATSGPFPAPGRTPGGRQGPDATAERIALSVALKAAVDLLAARPNDETLGAPTTNAVDKTLRVADAFLAWLLDEEKPTAIVSPVEEELPF